MASLTVRNIPDDAKLRFRQIAAAHGRSMEEHLRQLVINASMDDQQTFTGVRDVTHNFRHFETEPEFVSSGSPVIDGLLKSWRGLEFDQPEREPMDYSDVFDPKDYR
jgi:plasmid stability protein